MSYNSVNVNYILTDNITPANITQWSDILLSQFKRRMTDSIIIINHDTFEMLNYEFLNGTQKIILSYDVSDILSYKHNDIVFGKCIDKALRYAYYELADSKDIWVIGNKLMYTKISKYIDAVKDISKFIKE